MTTQYDSGRGGTSSFLVFVFALLLGAAALAQAEEPGNPKPVPVTRPEMKQALEALTRRPPRLPLPALTDEEKAQLGDRPVVNNARMRMLYLAEELRGGDFGRGADPAMTLNGTFKTELFWIVSRTNNCQYCLGHQEIKLAVAGLKEEAIAALDGDWAEFTPEDREQRILNKKRIPDIARYMVDNEDGYVFASITASYKCKTTFKPVDGTDLGLLEMDFEDANFVINDGQHRCAAIAHAIRIGARQIIASDATTRSKARLNRHDGPERARRGSRTIG